jgi:hypothetical protein
MTLVPRFPTTLTVLPTYKCSAACEHCCFGSHSGIEQRIPLDRLLGYIDQAAALGSVRLVVFSGGECFLLGDELVVAIARATVNGLATRCVSNGFWAHSEERAAELLGRLRDAGLKELNVSTGDYHQRFVPPSRVVTAALAGVRLGMRVVLVVESRVGRRFTADHLLTDARFHELLGDPRCTVIESPWMTMSDDPAVTHDPDSLVHAGTLYRRRGCDSVLNTIVITPREQLGACCGLTREQIPEMHVGSLRDAPLEVLVERAFGDFMKVWLSVDGPEHILAWAAARDPRIEWEHRYSHHCDACRALYHDPRVAAVIRDHHHEVVSDVLLRFAIINKEPSRPLQLAHRASAASSLRVS